MAKDFTKQDLLDFIVDHTEEHGHEPSLSYIHRETKVLRKDIHALFDELVEDGEVIKLPLRRSSQYTLK